MALANLVAKGQGWRPSSTPTCNSGDRGSTTPNSTPSKHKEIISTVPDIFSVQFDEYIRKCWASVAFSASSALLPGKTVAATTTAAGRHRVGKALPVVLSALAHSRQIPLRYSTDPTAISSQIHAPPDLPSDPMSPRSQCCRTEQTTAAGPERKLE